MSDKLTHKDLARDLGVSETTIKSYRRKFPEFIDVAARGKPLRFEPEAMQVCRLIRACFSDGLSVEETRRRLTERFPAKAAEVEPASPPPDRPQAGGLSREDLAGLMEGFREAVSQAASQRPAPETDAKLGRIQQSLEDLINLQTRNAAQQAELLARLDTLLDSIDKMGQPRKTEGRGRIFVARTEEQEGRQPVALEAPAASEEAPPEDFLDMPVVIRSGRGEFLGVTGPAGVPFSLREFEHYLMERAGSAGGRAERRWERQGEERTLTLSGTEQEPSQTHVLTFSRTRTPRGNLVALLHKLAIEGREVSDNFLQAFFKQIKDAVA